MYLFSIFNSCEMCSVHTPYMVVTGKFNQYVT